MHILEPLAVTLYVLLPFLFQISSAQTRFTSNRIRGFSRTTTGKPLTTTITSSMHEEPSVTLQGRTGQFFVYEFSPNDFDTLLSANKGRNTIRERFGINGQGYARFEYSASINGRPDLPSWLNLAKMPADQPTNRAFLYGTPERDEFMDDILRYTAPANQVAEVWIQNYDAWEILSASSNAQWSSDLSLVTPSNSSGGSLLDQLRFAISKAFRGRGVRPYIVDLKPATHAGARAPSSEFEKVGFVVYVGTANAFPLGLRRLAVGLTTHQDLCNRSEIIPPNSYFVPAFHVDWCRFKINNVTQSDAKDAAILIDGLQVRGATGLTSYDAVAPIPRFGNQRIRHYEPVARQRDYSWEWVMVAVVPLAILLVLVLILSAVFFGCREGQHWRDYKTPREQLAEYVNLRRTQDRLRMLSNQRQSIDILDATEEPPPVPIGRRVPAPASPTLSVGKQTVAQAAAVRGSGIDLYKDTDSFDERDQLLVAGAEGMYRQGEQRRMSSDQHDPLRRPSYDDQRRLITRDSSV